MTYKVRGTSSDGETFYVDGSEHGKTFSTQWEANKYAVAYASAVGEYEVHGLGDDTYIRARQHDGYFEDIRVIRNV